ncbi:MAG TPA: GNAT family N-acetyltransferase [Micromonosporaceae bacterium]|nr:GNAT family N-acetyltransferase [Micromonosporaceae bacterium]
MTEPLVIAPLRVPADVIAAEVIAWCEIVSQGRLDDSGTLIPPELIAEQILADDGAVRFAAHRDGLVVGAAEIRPQHDGGFARLYVPVAHRRTGIGRALSAAALAEATTRRMARVSATVVAGQAGEAFAAALRARTLIRLVTVERRLDEAAPAVPTPSGVAALSWTGRCPDALLDGYAKLKRHIMDAPDAALQIDGPEWTPAIVRAWEARHRGRLLVDAAVDEGTGALLGVTEVVAASSGAADQLDTIVAPESRGRGIATWLKATMIDRLRRDWPSVDRLTSTVNERNTPMLVASERTGFHVAWRRRLVTVDLTAGTGFTSQ